MNAPAPASAPTPGDIAIEVTHVAKVYRIWRDPAARLKYPLLRMAADLLPRWLQPPALRRRVKPEAGPGYYRDFFALNDVSFTLRRGETVGIIGRNGSGKSTLLQIISGTLTPTHGRTQCRGRVAALLELGSGFNPEFTGRENVYLNGTVLGLSQSEIDRRFEAIAAFADIGEFMEQPVKTYSSGMALRLAFAVIAHVDADILIVDEALSVGDVFFVQKCMRFLKEFCRRGTLLFVTHNASDLTALCDRAIWLEGGTVQEIGPAEAVSRNYLARFAAAMAATPAPVAREDRPPPELPAAKPVHDWRTGFLDATAFKSEFRPFAFDPDKPRYGAGGARIVDVRVEDPGGERLASFKGGEEVVLCIRAEATREIPRPILGFYLKNRQGQYVFGDNTYLTNLGRELVVPAGGSVEARFRFQMPLLPYGPYVVAPALASGDQDHHVQLDWLHEALVIESLTNRPERGLVGLPMLDIETTIQPPAPADAR